MAWMGPDRIRKQCAAGIVHGGHTWDIPHDKNVYLCWGVKDKMNKVYKYRITVVESERGWGQRSEYEYFDTPEQAQARIESINSRNNLPYVPDWYMYADEEIRLVEVDYEPKHAKEYNKFTDELKQGSEYQARHKI